MTPRIFPQQLAQRLRPLEPAVNRPAFLRSSALRFPLGGALRGVLCGGVRGLRDGGLRGLRDGGLRGLRDGVLRGVLGAVLICVLTGCGRKESTPEDTLLIFAAANMRDALTEVARHHRDAGGDSAVLVFGSTGDLATQIANGAPVDLFFAADTNAIDQLSANGHVQSASRSVYAVGRLAIVARCTRADTAVPTRKAVDASAQMQRCPRLDLADLLDDSLRTIAIADPSHAPYGRAAQQVLERSGMWEAIRPKLVLGANISQAALFVTSGNADAGIVALSVLPRASRPSYTLIDASLHEALVQSLAISSRSRRAAQARAFVEHVLSENGRAVLQRYGFDAPLAASPLTHGR